MYRMIHAHVQNLSSVGCLSIMLHLRGAPCCAVPPCLSKINYLLDSLAFLRSLGFLGDGDLLTDCIGDAFLRLVGLGERLRLGLEDSRRLTLSGD